MIAGLVIGLVAIIIIGGLTYWLCYKRGQSLTSENSKKEASKTESKLKQSSDKPCLSTKLNTPPSIKENVKLQKQTKTNKKPKTKQKDEKKTKPSSKSNRQSKTTRSV